MPVLIVEKEDHIMTLTMNRPERMNAMNPELSQALEEAWIDLRNDDDIWVAIITGAGDRAFCAGADLRDMSERAAAGQRQLGNVRGGRRSGMMRNHPTMPCEIWKPVICAINGWCLAGGCEMACSCDIRIMEEHAMIGVPESKRGLGAKGVSATFARIIRLNLGLELLWTGDPFTAQRAYEVGLANLVVPKGQSLAVAKEWARKFCQNAPLSLRFQKERIYRSSGVALPLALLMNALVNPYASEDVIEGARAAREGRQPVWKGR